MRRLACPAALAAALLSGCLSDGGGEDTYRSVSLAEAGLAGQYDLVHVRLELTTGEDTVLSDPRGWMRITRDSAWSQRVWLDTALLTGGRVHSVKARGRNASRGILTLGFDGSDTRHDNEYSLSGDTLTLVIRKAEAGDAPGFVETDRYVRFADP